jgi:hypothetical protein
VLVVEPILVKATKRFHHGYFPHCTGQRIDFSAPKPSCPNGPGFGFEEGSWTHQATGALALLQALSLAPSGNLGTQVNTMA